MDALARSFSLKVAVFRPTEVSLDAGTTFAEAEVQMAHILQERAVQRRNVDLVEIVTEEAGEGW